MLPPHGKVWPSRGTHNCGVAYTYSIMTRLIVELCRISPISFLFFFPCVCICACLFVCMYVCHMYNVCFFFFIRNLFRNYKLSFPASRFLSVDRQHCTAALDSRRYLKIVVSFVIIVFILIYCLTSLFLNYFFISSQYRDLSFLSMI